MEKIFKHSNSYWVKYSEYEKRKNKNGEPYIAPAPKSEVKMFKPLENAEQMVIDALNVGLICMSRESTEQDKEQAVLGFVSEYGLLGFMTAIPTTPKFMDFDTVYLLKNQFIKAETMSTYDYIDIFFPFEKLNITGNGENRKWDITGDVQMMALAMTKQNEPMAAGMEAQRNYAEPYDWLVRQFKDWAFTFYTSILYYNDFDKLGDEEKSLYRQAMGCFDGIAPTYHIELLDKPTIVWDFHSLLLEIQIMFSFMLTNGKNPLKICKHCSKVFKATRPKAVFCSPQCKNRYNVYKSRAKNRNKD